MISVVIPAYNAQETLGACLAALLSQVVGRERFEVIVVDDGSADRTAEVASGYGVRLIQQPNAGPASARNRGVQHARGEIVLFTDADCEPSVEWIAQMVAPLGDPQVVGVKGAYRTRQRALVARFVQLEYEHKYARLRRRPEIDFVDTYAAAYWRAILVESGGFDTTFPVPSVEDQELSFRLARKGYRLVFAPQAVVYHRHDETVGEYWRRKYAIGYWKAVVLRRYPERVVRDSHTPQTQKAQVGLVGLAVLFCALSPWLPSAAWGAVLAGGLFLAAALPLAVRIARSDPPVLLVAPLLIVLRALALGLGLAAGTLSLAWRALGARFGDRGQGRA